MKFMSTFSGIGAASVSWKRHGIEPVAYCEIEPFPCHVLSKRFGASAPKYLPEKLEAKRGRSYKGLPDWRGHNGIVNFGDITQVTDDDLASLGKVDVLEGGPPCFSAGTLISTDKGMVPIESVSVGDRVLTHKGRYMSVLRVGGKKDADTILVKGQGHHGIVTTHEHPFYARKKAGRDGLGIKVSEPQWIEAKDLKGYHWASISKFPSLRIPAILKEGNESIVPDMNEDFFWLVGAYLGDGYVRISDRRGSVVFSVNDAKRALVEERLNRLGLHYRVSKERTSYKVFVGSKAMTRWVVTHFGAYCDGKKIPAWALGMKRQFREALFDGYCATDGSKLPTGGVTISTVGRELAFGTKMLINSLGMGASVGFVKKSPTHIIEGRVVNQRSYYTVSSCPSTRSSFEIDGIRYGLVRSVSDGEKADVFNLEVETDNSYVADGIVVHNCQAFSLAGLRKGLNDDRGNLTLAFVSLFERMQRINGTRYCVFENVKGVLNDKTNAFGNLLGAFAGSDGPLVSPGGKWSHSGYVDGPAGAVAWRLFDARYWGVPQRRERVYAVAVAGSAGNRPADPGEILFVEDGHIWNRISGYTKE